MFSKRIQRRWRVAPIFAVTCIGLASCGSSTRTQSETAESSVVATTALESVAVPASVDATTAWQTLNETENSYTAGDISETDAGTFGLMAAPTLRFFEFVDGRWTEATSSVISRFDIPTTEFEYDITIQSVDVTNDGAVDYVVNFAAAPWHVLDVPNQGRDYGTVISGHDGNWKSLEFTDPYGGGDVYTSVEHIEYFNGALVGDWYGSCGRPCGKLIYEWLGGSGQLVGEEATPSQVRALPKPWCTAFSYNENLPLERCDEGRGVAYVQEALNGLGYELEADGYYGNSTRFAVKYYQRSNGIRASGAVDAETWRSLFAGVRLPGNDLNSDGLVTPNEFGD